MPLRDAMLFYILKYLSRKIFVRKKVRKTTFLHCARWSYHLEIDIQTKKFSPAIGGNGDREN